MDNPILTIQATGDKQKTVAGIQPRRSHLLRVSKRKTMNDERTRQGFTLVELMIVVAILGILAAIVFPQFQGHIQKAKEAAAKDNLRIIREAIERYAAEHNGIAPGYVNGVFSSNTITLQAQFLYCTSFNGDTILQKNKSGSYIYGPYLNILPKNPFNEKTSFQIISDLASIPASATGNNGWIYKPFTKELKLDYPGNDSEGNSYFSY